MKKYKAIVVGAGAISKAWFPALLAENVDVVAVVDIRKSAAEERIAEFKLEASASNDLARTLKKTPADFAVDLTVPEAHCKVTCAAMKAGLHVLGEKPIASSMAEARRMIRASERTGKMYMVDQSRRWNLEHAVLSKTVAAGKIGKLTTVNCDFYLGPHWTGFRTKMASPLLLDMSIHHFDLARMVSHEDPVSVYAQEFNPVGSWYRGDVAANCIFEMTNGVVFAYRGSWCAEGFGTGWGGSWRLIGSRGTILYEDNRPPRGEAVAGGKGFQRAMKPVKMARATMKYTSMRGALREMLAFLRTGKTPQTECHDNIRSLAMVFAAIESSKKGKRILIRAC